MNDVTTEWLHQQIVELAHDAIVFADREGIIRLWNDGAEAMFGHRREEALGQPLDIIIPERLRERHWEGYRRAIIAGTTRYRDELLKVPAVRKDGTRISLEFTILPIQQASGKMLGFAAILRDVTARWLEDRALRERLAKLEAQATSSSDLTRSGSTSQAPDGSHAG